MLEQIGDEILKFTEINTGTQIARIAENHVCFATKVVLSGPEEIRVNEPATFTAKYYDWLDNPLSEESRPILVIVGEQKTTINPENGQAEFDLIFDYVPGGNTFIKAVGFGFGCETAIMEVEVLEDE